MPKHFVSSKDESPRMFKSDFLDFFSRVPPILPILIYLPLIAFSAYQSYIGQLSWLNMGLLFLAGIFFWTLTEYILHRFVFHYHPTTELGKRINFLFHGVHHDFPQDSKRLVMPPPFSIPLAIFFFFALKFIFSLFGSWQNMWPFFTGLVSGYLVYDMLHYSVHHLNFKIKYFQDIKKHHMKHHFQQPDAGFGFTSKLWDIVFRTEIEETPVNKNQEN